MNPSEFTVGQHLMDTWTRRVYVLLSIHHGVAQLQQRGTLIVESWNAFNNDRFVLAKGLK